MIGEALRLIRVFHDKKSRDLAAELGISASYLSEIENGHKRPSIDLIAKYAEVFNTKSSVIMFFAEELTGSGKVAAYAGIREKLTLFMRSVDRFTQLDDD